MKSVINWVVSRTSKYLPYPSVDESDEIEYFRIRLLYLLIICFIFFGFLACVPSLYISIKEKLWDVVIIDTGIYLTALYVGFSKIMSVRVKIWVILSGLFFLGISLLVILGPYGAGFIWLFLVPVLAGILLNFRAVIGCLIIIFVSLALLTIPIVIQKPTGIYLTAYDPIGWLVNVANFISVNFVISASLSILLTQLNKSLVKEKETSRLLELEKKKITDEKLHAEESDNQKSAFLANVSHEIRTPMNGILGFADLLSEPEIEESKRNEYIQLIQESGERMLKIINNLVNISKIESNQIELFIETTEINSLLRELQSFFTPTASKKNIILEFKSQDKYAELTIKTDKTKLEQVISNLIYNAIKFTEKGNIKFGFEMDEDYIQFFIRDTGTGIEPERQSIIFDRFHRTETKTNSSKNLGMGLGLAISKAYIEMMGGKIWVDSEPGKGACFQFRLPVSLKQAQDSTQV